MRTIVVRKESTAKRCEICHKADSFDVETQICVRCFDYQQVNLNIQPLQDRTKLQKQEFFRRLNYSYQRNLETAKRLNQQDNQVVITSAGTFLISLIFLPLFQTYWLFLTIPLLVFSGLFSWRKGSDTALGIFQGILLSYGFLVFCILLVGTGIFAFFLLFAIFLVIFITKLVTQ